MGNRKDKYLLSISYLSQDSAQPAAHFLFKVNSCFYSLSVGEEKNHSHYCSMNLCQACASCSVGLGGQQAGPDEVKMLFCVEALYCLVIFAVHYIH